MAEELSIRSLILTEEAEKHEVKHRTTTKSPVVYEVVANSGIDFAVRRTCGKSKTLLCIIASQEQYYVKKENTGKIERLDAKTLSSFLRGESVVHVGNQWCEELRNTKLWRDNFLLAIYTKGFKELVKAHAFNTSACDKINFYRNRLEEKINCIREYGPIAKEVMASGFGLTAVRYSARLQQIYGLEHARDFIQRACESGELNEVLRRLIPILTADERWDWEVDLSARYGYEQHLLRKTDNTPRVRYEYPQLCRYIFEQAAAEGYADSVEAWIRLWYDTLNMQIQLLGRIVVKYPENLATYHDKLAYEVRQKQVAIDTYKWTIAAEAHKAFEYHNDKYLVVAPKEPDDMRDEAVQQANCLASYIKRVTEGNTMIFFVRKASRPDKSYLTVEVSPSRKLVQVKASHNREADAAGFEFLKEWCDAFEIEYASYRTQIEEAANDALPTLAQIA